MYEIYSVISTIFISATVSSDPPKQAKLNVLPQVSNVYVALYIDWMLNFGSVEE